MRVLFISIVFYGSVEKVPLAASGDFFCGDISNALCGVAPYGCIASSAIPAKKVEPLAVRERFSTEPCSTSSDRESLTPPQLPYKVLICDILFPDFDGDNGSELLHQASFLVSQE